VVAHPQSRHLADGYKAKKMPELTGYDILVIDAAGAVGSLVDQETHRC